MLHCISLRHDALALSRSTRIIKAREFSTLTQSIELIEKAREISEQQVREAAADISAQREAAKQEGLRAGEMQSTEQIVLLKQKIDRYLGGVEQELAELVFDAVKKIVLNFDDMELVRHSIQQGLKQVRARKHVSVRVSQLNVSQVEAFIDSMDTDGQILSVVADNKLQGRDCVIESDIGIVNSSVSTQLTALAKVLGIKTEV